MPICSPIWVHVFGSQVFGFRSVSNDIPVRLPAYCYFHCRRYLAATTAFVGIGCLCSFFWTHANTKRPRTYSLWAQIHLAFYHFLHFTYCYYCFHVLSFNHSSGNLWRIIKRPSDLGTTALLLHFISINFLIVDSYLLRVTCVKLLLSLLSVSSNKTKTFCIRPKC